MDNAARPAAGAGSLRRGRAGKTGADKLCAAACNFYAIGSNALEGSGTYKGPYPGGVGLALSAGGKRIVSGSDDGTVQVWEAASGRHIWSYAFPSGRASFVFAVAWSPDGRRIAAGGQAGTVEILDAASGHLLTSYQSNAFSIQGIAWSPDGKRLAVGSQDQDVRVWDTMSGKLLATMAQSDAVERVAWSPDGKEIASACHDGTVQIWNATSGQPVLTYSGNGAPVWSVAWSPDGRYIVSGTGGAGQVHQVYSNNSVKVWDAATGRTLLSYKGHSGQVYA